MNRVKLHVTLSILILLTLSAFSQDNVKDVDAIKSTIQSAYVDGLQNEGDMQKIDQGFHPGFNLLGIGEEDEMWNLPIEKWKEKVAERLASGEMPRTGDKKVSVKFLDVDVTGTAAVAKIEFYVGPTLTFIDYISLYKFGENWKIVNKIYYKIEEKKQ